MISETRSNFLAAMVVKQEVKEKMSDFRSCDKQEKTHHILRALDSTFNVYDSCEETLEDNADVLLALMGDLKGTIDALVPLGQALPFVGLALVIVSKTIEISQRTGDLREEMSDLIEKCKELQWAAGNVQLALSYRNLSDADEKEIADALKRCCDALNSSYQVVEKYERSNGIVRATVFTHIYKPTPKELVDRLKDALIMLMGWATSFYNHIDLRQVVKDLKHETDRQLWLRWKFEYVVPVLDLVNAVMGSLGEQAVEFEPLQELRNKLIYQFNHKLDNTMNFGVNVTQFGEWSGGDIAAALRLLKKSGIDSTTGSIETDPMEFLTTVLRPEFVEVDYINHRNRYQEGTRGWLLVEVKAWIRQVLGGPKAMWLKGGAGLGKSVMAAQVVELLAGSGQLGGYFFCRHNNAAQNNATKVLNSIIWQFALKFEWFRGALEDRIKTEYGGGFDGTLEERFDKLFVSLLTNQRPWGHSDVAVVVIDALDELEAGSEKQKLLKLLGEEWSARSPAWVKLFLTGRPEPDICTSLAVLKPVEIQPSEENNLADLRIVSRLIAEAFNESHCDSKLDKKTVGLLEDRLATNASGVFVYLKMAKAFLGDLPRYDEQTLDDEDPQLSRLLEALPRGLDDIYVQTFSRLFTNIPELKRSLLAIVAAIMTVREPVSVSVLAWLVNQDVELVERQVGHLAALFPVNTQGCVEMMHKSVRDFCCGGSAQAAPFHVDVDATHVLIGNRCLGLLQDQMPGLVDSRKFLPLVPLARLLEQGERLSLGTPSASVQYAVKHWVAHLNAPAAPSGLRVNPATLEWIGGAGVMAWLELAHGCGALASATSGLGPLRARLQLAGCEGGGDTGGGLVASQPSNEADLGGGWGAEVEEEDAVEGIDADGAAGCLQWPGLCNIRSPTSARRGAGGHWSWGGVTTTNQRGRGRGEQGEKGGMEVGVSVADVTAVVRDVDRYLKACGVAFLQSLPALSLYTGTAGLPEGRLRDVLTQASGADGNRGVVPADPAWSQCLQTMLGAGGIVNSVAFSPDGQQLVVGGRDLCLWSVATGECIRVMKGHTEGVASVAFSPDGRHVASGSWDSTVRLWEVETGECVKVLEGLTKTAGRRGLRRLKRHMSGRKEEDDTDKGVNSVAFSPDGHHLASGSDDSIVRLWEVETGDCVQVLEGHTGKVLSVAFSPDGRHVASGSYDHTVKLWEVSTGDCAQVLEGHPREVVSVAFSPDGRHLASGSGDKTVRLWEVATGACAQVLEGHTEWVESVAFSPDGCHLASGSLDMRVRLWEVETGDCVRVLEGHSWRVDSVAFSPDGCHLASGSFDTTVRLWEVAMGEVPQVLEGHTDMVISVAFPPDRRLLASGSKDGTVRLWEVVTGDCVRVLEGHGDMVWSVEFSPDGRHLASGSRDETVRLWEVATGACVQVLEGHAFEVRSVAFSPDGRHLASGSWDCTVRLWELATGACTHVLQDRDLVDNLAFSSDGRHLVSGWGMACTYRIWEVATGVCTGGFEDRSFESVLESLATTKEPESSSSASHGVATAGPELEATDHSVVVRVGPASNQVTVTMPLVKAVSDHRGFETRSSDGKTMFWSFDNATSPIFRVCSLDDG